MGGLVIFTTPVRNEVRILDFNLSRNSPCLCRNAYDKASQREDYYMKEGLSQIVHSDELKIITAKLRKIGYVRLDFTLDVQDSELLGQSWSELVRVRH